jgi:hypothetical protein
MTRNDLIEHYRHVRGVAGDIQNSALDLVSAGTMIEFGRRLGAVRMGKVCLNHQEIKLLYDLAIHTGRPGRSRAIDRYARATALPPGCDEARALLALQQAEFTMFRIEGRHELAGAKAYDLLRKQSFHFMDIAIGLSSEPGDAFVGRLLEIDGFRMSCITLVPLLKELLEQSRPRLPAKLPGSELEVFQDPRCAIAIYRTALDLGYMRRTVSFDPVKAIPTERDVAMVRAINDRLSADLPALTDAD